jgi:putative DNA primase/helicase
MDELYRSINTTLSALEKKADETELVSPDTEDDLGLIFSDKYQDYLRYVDLMGKWLLWDGKVWKQDQILEVFDLVRKLCRKYFSGEEALRKRFLNASTVSAIERLVRSDIRHRATVDQWDADDWILNTPAGIVNLKTGDLQPHDADKHCTKITSAGPSGDCPIFLKFLNDITANDQDLIDFIQRVMGYACSGSTKEHALFFFYGTGANGKGTLLNTITNILKDYAVIASTDVFTESRHDRHPTELAALMGARLVVAQETDEGRKWAESRLKALTGGDPITARFMRQDFFTYMPKFTLIIAGNHKPSIQTIDEAIRRRLHLVPFTVTIPKEKRDPDLAEKLLQESAGIMRWLIDGAVAYCDQGLNPPQSVLEATEHYFEDENTLAQWMADCCETATEYWETPTGLFNSWKAYASASNFSPGTNKDFKSKLEAVGIRQSRTGKRGRRYEGIKLKPEIDENYGGDPWER